MTSPRPSRAAALVLGALLALPYPGVAQAPSGGSGTTVGESTSQVADSADVAATIRAFHEALRTGDADAARALLAEGLLVAESGSVEGREEYVSHHLPADMAFAAAVDRQEGDIDVTVLGDAAWAMSASTTTGTYRDRPIDSRGAELMVLSREDDGWLIRAIHWSSRQVR